MYMLFDSGQSSTTITNRQYHHHKNLYIDLEKIKRHNVGNVDARNVKCETKQKKS